MNKKQVDMKPAGQPKQPGCGEYPKSYVPRTLVLSFLFNVNFKRALIGLCLLMTSHWGQIRDIWDSQVFTVARIVIGLLLHIHYFINLRF